MSRVGLICHGGSETGNERYMVELIRTLLRRDDGLRYSVFYTRETTRAQLAAPRGSNTTFHRLRPEVAWLRVPIALPWAIHRSRASLIHGQYALPPLSKTPAVLTVHDVFYRQEPDMYPLIDRLHLQYRVPRALHSARQVIVPSEATRRELMRWFDVDPGKLTVIPLGVSDRFRPLPLASLEPLRARLQLPEHFILYVGALQPRKNLARLIIAFGGLPSEVRHMFPLLIVGAHGWMHEDITRALQPLAQEGTVRFLGYLSDEDVPVMMNLATVFAYPSLSEGFGFSVLEAMRCGTCILAGRGGSLPEIVADAGLLVDPLDSRDIQQGLAALLVNPHLRAELRERGLRRAATYTWDRTAEATAAVYREALEETSGRRKGVRS